MIFMHFNSENSSFKFNRPHAFNEKQRLNKIQREHLVQFPSQVSLQEVQQVLERTIKLTTKTYKCIADLDIPIMRSIMDLLYLIFPEKT